MKKGIIGRTQRGEGREKCEEGRVEKEEKEKVINKKTGVG